MSKSFILLIYCGVLIQCQWTPKPQSSIKSFGHVAIMQGITTSSEANFVASVLREEIVQVELIDPLTDKILLNAAASSIVRDHAQWKLIQFRFSELTPGKQYFLKLKGEKGNWVDTRSFKTLANTPSRLRLGIASCMRDDLKNSSLIWNSVKSQKVDLLFMIGDNSYTSIGLKKSFQSIRPKDIWDRHMETRNTLSVFRWKNLVPVFSVWDDHDFGVNNGGRDFKYKKESAKIFQSFFPMIVKGASFSRGPGLARKISVGANNFLFLDNRSFRSTKTSKEPETHFGREQNEWLLGLLQAKKLNWLISGDQFFGGYHPFESFEGNHKNDFKNFLENLKSKKYPIVFVSGDRHISEITKVPKTKLGRTSFEITSSPIHSTIYPRSISQYKNSNRIKGVGGKWNYIVIDLKTDSKNYKLSLKSLGLENQVYFTDQLKIEK